MPNWTDNSVSITASVETIKSFVQKHLRVIEDNAVMSDFETLIPMPKDLRDVEAGSVTHIAHQIASGLVPPDGWFASEMSMNDEQHAHYKTLCETRAKMYAMPSVDGKSPGGIFHDEHLHPFVKSIPIISDFALFMERFKARNPKDFEMAQRILANIQKHGFSDWYEFSTAKWGTKWNAGKTTANVSYSTKDVAKLKLYFNTPWCEPIGIIKQLEADYGKVAYIKWTAVHEGESQSFHDQFGSAEFNFRGWNTAYSDVTPEGLKVAEEA